MFTPDDRSYQTAIKNESSLLRGIYKLVEDLPEFPGDHYTKGRAMDDLEEFSVAVNALLEHMTVIAALTTPSFRREAQGRNQLSVSTLLWMVKTAKLAKAQKLYVEEMAPGGSEGEAWKARGFSAESIVWASAYTLVSVTPCLWTPGSWYLERATAITIAATTGAAAMATHGVASWAIGVPAGDPVDRVGNGAPHGSRHLVPRGDMASSAEAWGPVPKSAGRRNRRAQQQAKAVLQLLARTWVQRVCVQLGCALAAWTILTTVQANSVGHLLVEVSRLVATEAWKSTPNWCAAAAATAGAVYSWTQFRLVNTNAIMRFIVLNPKCKDPPSRFKRTSKRNRQQGRGAPSSHDLRRRASLRRAKSRRHARRGRKRRRKPRQRHQARAFATQAGEVDSAVPLGREDDVEALHVRDEELDVIMGPQAGFNGEGAWTDEEWQDLRNLLLREKSFMATSATDLPGYTGEIGKFDIPFKDESASHYQKPRRFSPAERNLIDEHFNKLLADGIIEKAPKYCENTCNVVVAMKKALDGSWTDKRVALDLRGINELSLRDRTPPRLPEDLFHDISKSFPPSTTRAPRHRCPAYPRSQQPSHHATRHDTAQCIIATPSQLLRLLLMQPLTPSLGDKLLAPMLGGQPPRVLSMRNPYVHARMTPQQRTIRHLRPTRANAQRTLRHVMELKHGQQRRIEVVQPNTRTIVRQNSFQGAQVMRLQHTRLHRTLRVRAPIYVLSMGRQSTVDHAVQYMRPQSYNSTRILSHRGL
ncbi:hypothetical protein CYMTET_52743 [Cymbomonas tetramitiformis]|uniref:Uncharacterized protein n=1 Tax=Cymbomonas tetramitiformis TaxID=36881 RepID=A0AAE0BID9_9CHLO|nr:hypothetical protein CYMTET_52743 [Cymbomonas tetramitiformis]